MRQTYGVSFAGHRWELPTRSDANRVRRVLRAHAADGGRCDLPTLECLVTMARDLRGYDTVAILDRLREKPARNVPIPSH